MFSVIQIHLHYFCARKKKTIGAGTHSFIRVVEENKSLLITGGESRADVEFLLLLKWSKRPAEYNGALVADTTKSSLITYG